MYRYLKTSIVILGLLVAAVFIKGCATADALGSNVVDILFDPDPTVVQTKVEIAKDVNPDSRGRPSPVKIRFYLLKSASVFKSADFFQLKEQDRELLGEDIRLREEKVFKPGDEDKLELSLPAEEMPQDDKLYLAVMVGYWDLDHSKWRAVREIEMEETTEVAIAVARSDVSIKLID